MFKMKLLIQAKTRARRGAEEERLRIREALKRALHELLPGHSCWLYGSITTAGRFREWSDVDLAVDELPASGPSLYLLLSLLSERVGRPVDVVVISETRLREKILREGEQWIG